MWSTVNPQVRGGVGKHPSPRRFARQTAPPRRRNFDFSAHGRTWCLRANSPNYGCPEGTLGLQVGHNEISFDLQFVIGESYNWMAQIHAESVVESYSTTDPFDSIASVHAMNTAHSY